MARLQHVQVEAMDPHRFVSVLLPGEYEALRNLITHGARELHGRVIWNVNSTAKGGGVAEMLRPLLGYCRGAEANARWVVIYGGPEFFEITNACTTGCTGSKETPARSARANSGSTSTLWPTTSPSSPH